MRAHKKKKTRLIVLTDISSLQSRVNEPDDTQSLVRLLLYSNEFDIEGLVATYTSHLKDIRPEYIKAVINEYGKVRENLCLHDPSYPEAEELIRSVKCGNPKCGIDQVGPGKDTEGSDWIISVVDRPDPRPVWISIWGGPTDLAQALWKISNERNVEECRKFKSKIRVYSIADQYDTTGPWIRENHPDLFYITSYKALRGMYKGGESSLVSCEWVDENVINGHGGLGAIYPNYDGRDPWGKVKGVKEGDTPAFLYLIQNGVSDPMQPHWGSWGGRFTGVGCQYTDAFDSWNGETSEWATVFRWRPEYQASFQARLDWCVMQYSEANHEPVAMLSGETEQTVLSGNEVVLDAEGSYDPDGDELSYHWFYYSEPSSYKGDVVLKNADSARSILTAPEVKFPETLHILLTVTDKGTPALSSYKRVVITVLPK